MANANHTAPALTINLEATLRKLNRLCAATTGLESYEDNAALRKAVLVEIEKSRALTYAEYVNAYGYAAWVAKNKAATPAPVTDVATWPLIAHCPKCGETRARRQFATCATCGSPDVSYRGAQKPTRATEAHIAPCSRPAKWSGSCGVATSSKPR